MIDRRTSVPLLAAALALACAASSYAAEAGPRQRHASAADDTATVRVIVKYKADSTLMQAQSASGLRRPLHAATLSTRLGLPLQDRWVLGARTQSLSAQGVSAAELARRLAAQSDVEWAVPVRRMRAAAATPTDPYYKDGQTTITPTVGQWYLRAPTGTFVSATNAIGAWGITTGSSAVTVAVLDTGVRFDHPDFLRSDGSTKLYAGYDFVSHSDVWADGDGRDADASDPGDWTSATDPNGFSSWHGTQTASIVGAATDNGIGMASMGREVMVLPVRVLGRGGGWDDDIQAGMLWAAGLSTENPHPARVLNLSLGAQDKCGSYQDVVDQLVAAGVTVVVAAGNGVDAGGITVITPANCRGVITVGGVRHSGTKVGYSDLGPEVAIAAPAGNCVNTGKDEPCLYPILTATNAGNTTPSTNTWSNSTNYSIGTSFAAPQVAGAVALMLSVDPTLTPARIRSVLQTTARPFPSRPSGSSVPLCQPGDDASPQLECYCTTSTCGAGMLDVGAAVAAVAAVSPPTVTVDAGAGSPTVGDSVTLMAAATAYGGRAIAGYAWSVTEGGNLASISGSSTGSSVTLATTGAGSVTVQVVVTDSEGGSTTASTTLTVSAPATATSGGSGGGGGAFAPAWLALLALAAALSRRAQKARPAPAA